MSARAARFRLLYAAPLAVWPYFVATTWFMGLGAMAKVPALTVAAGAVLAAAAVRSLRIRIEIDEHELTEYRLWRTVRVPRSSMKELVLARVMTRRCHLPTLILTDGRLVPLKSLTNVMRPEHYLALIHRVAMAAGVRADLEVRRVFRLSGLTRRS